MPTLALSRREALSLVIASALAPTVTFDRAHGQASDAEQRLRALLDASEAAQNQLDPIAAARRGQHATGTAFVDPLSEHYAAALLGNKTREHKELLAIDRAPLGPAAQIAYDVFRYRTEQTLALFESGLFAVSQKAPLNASFGLHVELPDFVSGAGAPFATAADYEQGLERLEGFSGYMRSTVERLQQGLAQGYAQPKVIVENVLKQVDAMLGIAVEDSPFYHCIKNMPATVAAAERDRYAAAYRRVIEKSVYPAYRSWKSYLGDTYLARATQAPGRSAMKDGQALYAADLAYHTTTRMSAEQIHALGRSEVARIREEMERTRAQIGYKGALPQFFDYIRKDPQFYFTRPEQLLARFREIEARIWRNIPKLFARKPKAAFEVQPLPALGDQRGTGYYRQGPADASAPGVLFFNMSMLKTRPIPTLETLTLHEGIPGHHFQISLAQEDVRLPPLLRFGESTAYNEGWGLYAESLGKELGLFEDPYQWFGHLDMEMLRAVRLVVDTGIHAKSWTRQGAIAYMLDNTSMAPRDVEVEVDRYISAPGQACAYKIGELKIQELRKRATQAMKAKFDIKQFHEQVLDTGALPLEVLERKVDRWVGGGK
jgi:uncharacterized protein (DUF885 family)